MPSIQAALTTNKRFRLQKLLAFAVAIACGALWAFESAPFLKAHVSHDAGWDLYLANAILHGVRLDGPQMIEVNPPFLVWFFVPSVLLARLLHVSLSAGFRLFVLIGSTGLIAWSASLYRRICNASTLATWLFILCAVYIATGPVSLEDRGQREYFAAFLLLPYIFWATARILHQRLSSSETLLFALSAVVAICLKPQHVLDVVTVELLVLLRLRSVRQWFRPPLLVIAAGPVIYLIAVRLFVPSYLRDVVPLLKETYWGLDRAWTIVFHGVVKQALALAVAVILYAALRRRLRTEAFIACLLAGSVGALAAYLQQHKGWSYQALVLQIFAYLAVAIASLDIAERIVFERMLPDFAERLRTSVLALIAVAAIAFLVVGAMRLRAIGAIDYPQIEKSELSSIYSEYPPGIPVGLLAVDPWEWPEVLEQHKTWASRYMHLWLLPAIVRSQDPLDEDRAHHLSPAEVDQLSTLLRRRRRRTSPAGVHGWSRLIPAVPCSTSVPGCREAAIPACSTGSNATRSFAPSGRTITFKRRSGTYRFMSASGSWSIPRPYVGPRAE